MHIARYGAAGFTTQLSSRGGKDGERRHRASVRQLYKPEERHWYSPHQPARTSMHLSDPTDAQAYAIPRLQVAERIRHKVDGYTAAFPALLEIPSKDHPYDPEKDSVLKRVRKLFGE